MDTIYHYDFEFRFLRGATQEKRQNGVGIPANSTLVPPPQFEPGQIPVFDVKNQTWKIEKDTFWRPKSERQASLCAGDCDVRVPYEIILPNNILTRAPTVSLSGLLNGALFTVSLIEQVVMLNRLCSLSYVFLDKATRDLSAFPVERLSGLVRMANFNFDVSYIDYKNTVYQSIHTMRSICDLVITSFSLALYRNKIWNDKKFFADSIGSILHANSEEKKSIKKIIIKFSDDSIFLNRINEISNGLKHSFLNCESSQKMLSDYPIINIYHASGNNFNNHIMIYTEYISVLMYRLDKFLKNIFEPD